MSAATQVEDLVRSEYEHGFVTDIESDTLPPGLNEGVVRAISARKGEPDFMLEARLKAYRHWLTLTEPTWQKAHHEKINYQDIVYFSQPKPKKDAPPVDPLGVLRLSYDFAL